MTIGWLSFATGIAFALIGLYNVNRARSLRSITIERLPHMSEDEKKENGGEAIDGEFSYVDVMTAFENIESIADEINTATEINRPILYAASLALFISAVLSIAQGFGY